MKNRLRFDNPIDELLQKLGSLIFFSFKMNI